MGVKERVFEFIDILNMPVSRFEKKCGLSNGYLRSIKGAFSINKIEDILSAFPELNREWLMNGTGLMFTQSHYKGLNNETEPQEAILNSSMLPLIPIPAMCGYNEDNWSALAKDCPLYSVPEVPSADFLIRTSGDSMLPKYGEGDLLVCRMIQELLFFQWGKTYVIDTSQGVMVKNVYEDKENPDNILLVSENSEKYPPFAIPRKDIRKIALVVGSLRIRLEM
jgi:SOS-response transcriptional repressor LexA